MLAASVNFKIELVPFAFVEPLKARAFDCTDMHECVRLAIVPHEKAEAFHRIEELDGSSGLLTGQFALRSTATITAAIAATGRAATAAFNRNHIPDDLQILRGCLSAAIHQIVFETLTFGEAGKACTLDRGNMNEDVFSATFLLDEAKALLCVEEFHHAFAGSDDLCWHAVEAATATCAAAATKAASTAAAAIATAKAISAAAEPVATATKAVTATEIVAATEIAATAERIEAVFTKSVALVTAPATAPFIITHSLKRTFTSPPEIPSLATRAGGTPEIMPEKDSPTHSYKPAP